MGPPVPPLMDELIEEILLRVPADDPATLVRAALVSKRWSRILSGRAFRRRFRELHRVVLLGYFYETPYLETGFVPTSSFRLPHSLRRGWRVVGARHGRVLVISASPSPRLTPPVAEFIVWDPVTDDRRWLPMPDASPGYSYATVLCTAAGCDHLDCHRGPFLVVSVANCTDTAGITSVRVYSSQHGAWSDTISVLQHNDWVRLRHNALVGNALYFSCECNTGILEYDWGKQELLMISVPSLCHGWSTPTVLMTLEDGGLGLSTVFDSKLYLWSREAGRDGWAQQRVIDLNMLLPLSALSISPHVIAISDGGGVIFMETADGVFSIELKFNRVKKLGGSCSSFNVVPYTSFCTPVLGPAYEGEGPGVNA